MQNKFYVAVQAALFILGTLFTRIDAATFRYEPIVPNPSISNDESSHPGVSSAEIASAKIYNMIKDFESFPSVYSDETPNLSISNDEPSHPGVSSAEISNLFEAFRSYPSIYSDETPKLSISNDEPSHPGVSSAETSNVENLYPNLFKVFISHPSISSDETPNPIISNAEISHPRASSHVTPNPSIANDEISDSKISKFQFSMNVNYEEVKGLKNILPSLTNLLREFSSLVQRNNDENIVSEGIYEDLPQGSKMLKYFNPEDCSNTFTENIHFRDVTAAESYVPGYYPAKFGNDGDIFSFYHSISMRNPFWIASLGNTYKVVNITFYSRPDFLDRSIGVQFYVANDITFDTNGDPDFSSLTLFSERRTIPIGTDASIHEVPEGHYGNQVLVIKPVGHETLLEIAELQVSGYVMCD